MLVTDNRKVFGAIASGIALSERSLTCGHFDASTYQASAAGFQEFLSDTIEAVQAREAMMAGGEAAAILDLVMTFDLRQFADIFPWRVQNPPESASNMSGYVQEIEYYVEHVAIKYGYSVECKVESGSNDIISVSDIIKIVLRKKETKLCKEKLISKNHIERHILEDYPPRLLPPLYRREDGDPILFLQKYWQPLRGVGVFYQFVVGRYDPCFLKALKNYCHKNKRDLASVLPPKHVYTEDCARQTLRRKLFGEGTRDVPTFSGPKATHCDAANRKAP